MNPGIPQRPYGSDPMEVEMPMRGESCPHGCGGIVGHPDSPSCDRPMSTDEQRRPSTEAQAFDSPQHTAIYADLGTIIHAAERAINLLHDAEQRAAEVGAERDRLEAALRKAREQLLIEHGHDSDSDADWPACRIVHSVLDEQP